MNTDEHWEQYGWTECFECKSEFRVAEMAVCECGQRLCEKCTVKCVKCHNVICPECQDSCEALAMGMWKPGDGICAGCATELGV